MKNPLNDIKEQRTLKKRKEEKEQKLRKERLHQLEESKKQKKLIPHPIKNIKTNKEIKNLKEEIDYFENRKKKNIIIVGCVITWVLLMVLLMHNSSNEKKTADKVENATTQMTSKEITTATTQVKKEITTTEVATSENKEATTEKIVSDDTFITADDMNVSTLTDYAHVDSDIITLGEDEGVHITVEIAKSNINADEIIIDYDEDALEVESEEPYTNDDLTRFFYYVKGKKEGTTQFVVASKEEIQNKGEDANSYVMDIKILDEKEGKIVYVVNSTGEKYHYSQKCAGENATKTTYHDAVAYEYEPCGKCVQ